MSDFELGAAYYYIFLRRRRNERHWILAGETQDNALMAFCTYADAKAFAVHMETVRTAAGLRTTIYVRHAGTERWSVLDP